MKTVNLLRRRLGTVCSEGRLGAFVPVSNPVTQRLTVISEDASVSKKKSHFFSFSGSIPSVNSPEYTLTGNKKANRVGSLHAKNTIKHLFISRYNILSQVNHPLQVIIA